MEEREVLALAEVREAMKDPNVSLHLVNTFTHGRAVQVKIKSRKIGPLLFPAEDESVADVLMMLGMMAVEPEPEGEHEQA